MNQTPIALTPVTTPATWGALQALPVPAADRVENYGAAPQQTVEIRLPRSAGKHPVATRVNFLGTVGFPARKRWGRPFVVRMFRIRRIELGGVR